MCFFFVCVWCTCVVWEQATSAGLRTLADFAGVQTNALKTGNQQLGYFGELHNMPVVNAYFYERGVSVSQYLTEYSVYSMALASGVCVWGWGE